MSCRGGHSLELTLCLRALLCYRAGRKAPLVHLPSSVQALLEELPEEIQPAVLAKVSTRGRGGRTAAGDPRLANPNIDERKVCLYALQWAL